jgi:hypothetical protein
VEVEAGQRQAGRGGVHVSVHERRREQGPLPRDHAVGGRRVGGRAHPGDPAVDDVHGAAGPVADRHVGEEQCHPFASLALVDRIRGSAIGA